MAANTRHQLWKVYSRYKRELYAYALSITRNQASAEDVIHDTFVAVAQISSDMKNARAYIFRALRNTALKHMEGAKRCQPSEVLALEPLFVAPHEYRPDHRCLENEVSEQLDWALGQISFEQRETVVLRICVGMRFREIAELLDEPLATVTSRYRRALETLAHELKEYFDETQRCGKTAAQKGNGATAGDFGP